MAKDLEKWDPENEVFWESEGKKIANRNLWISIPSLLCGFAVWLYWGIITVQMLNLGFSFTQSELFTLTAIAGLSGATLRIPSTFFIRLAGGKNTIFLTTALLILPALGTGWALENITTPLWIFQFLALLSGIGGGNFASSMSNISFFYPKKVQGMSLGLNAGLGNFGVTTMQIVVPLIMTFGMFGGGSLLLKNTSGTFFGKIPEGTESWIQNAGFIWVLFLIPLSIACWFGMNNIRTKAVSPNHNSTKKSFLLIILMLIVGSITTTFGLWLMLPANIHGSGLMLSKWFVLPITIILTVAILKYMPCGIGSSLTHQYKIFNNKHTWAMTIIYTMTFGSFIGFSAAFPLAIKVIFGYKHFWNNGIAHTTINYQGPSALMYAWMGPFIGALIRPIGGKIADKFGGAKITQIMSIIMIISAVGVAYYMKAAYQSTTPQDYFIPFFILFLILFAASGIGNGSVFRSIAIVFNEEQTGPVLGWTSAIAAYGAFIIPQELSEQIKLTTPENALYGLAIFYAICVAINWWFYLRPNAYVKNP